MAGAMETANPPASQGVVVEISGNTPPFEQDAVLENKTKGKGSFEKKEVQVNPVKSLEKEIKVLTKALSAERKTVDQVGREKEKLALELLRVNKQREKLEELCRELQKQNKAVQDESKRRSVEEHKRREELSEKFQVAVADINARLATQSEEQGKQLQDNEALRAKLLDFAEKVEQREEIHTSQMAAKDLEQQLYEKRLEQEINRTAEATMKMEAYAEQASFLAKTEAELRSQLRSYSEKFEQFQEMLTSSHDAFTTFKADMEKMGKEIRKLKKENASLKEKSKSSDAALINALDVKSTISKKLETLELKNQRLEALCRTLQAERLKSKTVDEKIVEKELNEAAVETC